MAILYVALFVELICYLSSLRVFRLDMAAIFKQFSFFLLFVFAGEFFAFCWSMWIFPGASNGVIYNLHHAIMYLFYLYFYYNVLQFPKVRRAIKAISIFYVLFVVINLSFVEGISSLNNYTELLNTFIMVFLSISYYFQILRSKEIVSLRHDVVFWISTGVLIYHLGSMIELFLINIINALPRQEAQGIFMVVLFSAIIMYLCFATGFLWMKKK